LPTEISQRDIQIQSWTTRGSIEKKKENTDKVTTKRGKQTENKPREAKKKSKKIKEKRKTKEKKKTPRPSI
jgi:hypothetical protein